MTDSRKRAPHVARALQATAKVGQAKPVASPKPAHPAGGAAPPAQPGQRPASHVQAALASVQARMGSATPPARPLAPHVQAAVGRGVQAKVDPEQAVTRGAPAGRVRLPVAQPHGLTLPRSPRVGPHVIQRARSRGQGWSTSGEAFKAAFRRHAAATAPVTADNRQDADALAETVVAPSDQNCAAIYRYRRGEPPNERYIIAYATNTNQPAPTNAELQRQSEEMYNFFDYERIDNDEGIHCELVIISRFGTDIPYIGITKRCCLLCTLALKAVGFDVDNRTRGCHGQVYSTGWTLPSWIRGDEGLLQAFLGDEAFGLYQGMGEEAQRNARTWIGSGLSSI